MSTAAAAWRSAPKQPACLIVIDGWGTCDPSHTAGDAIANANCPIMKSLAVEHPCVNLEAHGTSVGLPEGLMGNSEVGHLNIGAGRIVYQDIVRIELAIKEKTFSTIPALVDAFDRARSGTGRVHFAGLVSDGGVHSHQSHLFHLLEAAKSFGVPEAYVHFYADGRDTKPKSMITYLEDLEGQIKLLNYGVISTITGRYYAMDRDKREERTKIAYDAMVHGVGECTESSANLHHLIHRRYEQGESDEFIKPIIVDSRGCVGEGDVLIFFNYRSDRMRQMSEAFSSTSVHVVSMTRYNALFAFPVLFPPQSMSMVMAEYLDHQAIRQCHVAETEKYAHVTFFFNGRREEKYAGEERVLIASPKVATYDLQPAMSVDAVASAVCEAVASGTYPFVMCNFAPPDMVGHTGNYQATLKAVEATDAAVGKVLECCKANGYSLFITADHGNAEHMIGNDNGPHTAHTCSKVPFIMIDGSGSKQSLGTPNPGTPPAALCDVCPTILEHMGLGAPIEMTGRSLLRSLQ